MGDVLSVLGIVLAALIVAAVLAPFESLGWWAGWGGSRAELGEDLDRALVRREEREDALGDHRDGREAAPSGDGDGGDGAARQVGPPAPTEAPPPCFVVFLSGIGTLSQEDPLPEEASFVADLRRSLPGGGVVTQVFPYSAQGVSLTHQRYIAWFWQANDRVKRTHGGLVTPVVNVRNLLQVLVSADGRYGPVLNYGLARQIVAALVGSGYDPERPRPVFLLGYSGGGQMAVGAATFVKLVLGTRVEVISLGGVISADPGLDRVDRLTRIYGTKDVIQRIGDWFLPPRWPGRLGPRWNRAVREGRVATVAVGPVTHSGGTHYLDTATTLADGRSPRAHSIDAILDVVRRSSDDTTDLARPASA